MRVAVILAALVLAGCASAPHGLPQPVSMPVSQPCRPVLSPEPDYEDSDAKLEAAPNLFERVKLLLAGRLQRIAREAELSAAVEACGK